MDNEILIRPPVVILARPQMGENIGGAARAMMNCGLSDLRIVAPRDGWPNATALPMAAGGKSIIENARVFETVAAASSDISFLVATSARRRDMAIRSCHPRGAAEMIVAHTNPSGSKTSAMDVKRTAMLFGPEASGLNNDEVVVADIVVTASLNPDYPSLNLAQAVLVMAWEWRMEALARAGQHQETMMEPFSLHDRASVTERDYFYKRLETALDDGGFFTAPDMVETVKRNIRALFNRASPSKQEISTLHGILQALTSKRKS